VNNSPVPGRILVLLLTAASVARAQSSAVESLVSAERAFARASTERGMRTAFLENLADDAIVFRPGPVPGRAAYEAAPDGPVYLDWKPMLAEASASGDFGFTTGPWEVRRGGRADTASAWGHYVTLWKRQGSGPWKVALDIGVSHEKPVGETFVTRSGVGADGTGAWESLRQADSLLGASGTTLRKAISDRLATDARSYRDGAYPVVWMAAVRSALASDARAYRASPLGGAAASSGDLGYTYGSYELAPEGDRTAERGYYLRIWRRTPGTGWQVILDLASATPG
jgi:ketosteroid isomerase-like protein